MDAFLCSRPTVVAFAVCCVFLFGQPEAPGSEPISLVGHKGALKSLVFSTDGKSLLSAGDNGNESQIYTWDLKSKVPQPLFSRGEEAEVSSLALSPDGKTLAVADTRGTELWNFESRQKQAAQIRGDDAIYFDVKVAFSSDSQFLAVSDGGYRADIWAIRDRKRVARLRVRDEPEFKPLDDELSGIAFTPDGKLVIAACVDGKITIWSAKNGAVQRTIGAHEDHLLGVACSPDGKSFASGGWNGVVRIWDLAKGAERLRMKHSEKTVSHVAWSPDGSTLASGGEDSDVAIWDAKTGRSTAVLKAQSDRIDKRTQTFALAFSPDGKIFATGGSDHTVRLWATDAWR